MAHPLQRLITDPAPALTCYGDERVELSGKVVINWLNKLVNYISVELMATPDDSLVVGLPMHWRALLWTQAGWLSGTEVVVGPLSGDLLARAKQPVAVVSESAEKLQSIPNFNGELIAVSLPFLSVSYRGELGFCLDGNREVMSQADALLVPVKQLEKRKILSFLSGRYSVYSVCDSECRVFDSHELVDLQLLKNQRVLLDLDERWTAKEVSALVLLLWLLDSSCVLKIKRGLDPKELVKAENVSISVTKTRQN